MEAININNVYIGKLVKNEDICNTTVYDNFNGNEVIKHLEYYDHTYPVTKMVLFENRGGYAFDLINNCNTGYPIFNTINEVVKDENNIKYKNAHIKRGQMMIADAEPILGYVKEWNFNNESKITLEDVAYIVYMIRIHYGNVTIKSRLKYAKRDFEELIYDEDMSQFISKIGVINLKKIEANVNKVLSKSKYRVINKELDNYNSNKKMVNTLSFK